MFTRFASPTARMFWAIIIGLLVGFWGNRDVLHYAARLTDTFVMVLKYLSLPLIFLSVVAAIGSMECAKEARVIGFKVLKYTLFTTFLAAATAGVLVWLFNPGGGDHLHEEGYIPDEGSISIWQYLLLAALVGAVVVSVIILSLPYNPRKKISGFFVMLHNNMMWIIRQIVLIMPIVIIAFMALLVKELGDGLSIGALALYLLCVVLANLIQAIFILPALLRRKGINPKFLLLGTLPAMTLAFFSKSSTAALPVGLQCAKGVLGLSPRVSQFSLPLCTAINMNACAAFIYTTVMFVAVSNGVTFTIPEMGLWVVIATLAAIGNAGIPMGCYFLSYALLSSMGVPLALMGAILPFYGLIDMLESAINVWSDMCVTAMVDAEVKSSPSPDIEVL